MKRKKRMFAWGGAAGGGGALGLLLSLSVWSGAAAAQTAAAISETEGHVLELDDGDIVVDLARNRGARDGTVVELWRPLSLKHPVTGETITDRFLIGRLRLTQVRDVLALAKADGKLLRPAEPGDVVILRQPESPSTKPGPATRAFTQQPAAAAAPAKPLPSAPKAPGELDDTTEAPNLSGTNREASVVSRLFDGLRGADVPTRILAYEKYVRKHPRGRYAAVLYEEAAQLRKLIALENAEKFGSDPRLKSFEAPDDVLTGADLEIAVEVEHAAAGAVLHSRNDGEVSYTTTPMVAVGEGYYSAIIPAARVKAPRFEYFIEATRTDGRAVALVASAAEPERLRVHAVPRPTPAPRHDATVSLTTDYADWNNFKGNDWVWQTEGYVGMRFRDVGVRAARTGFGVYRGRGGSLEELDQLKLGARAVGLTYGYLEGEFGISHFTAIVTRLVIGLKDDGVAGGAQALIRLGNDKETNLMFGGELLGGVGLRGITQLELNTFRRVPIVLRTEVTNQPAGVSDISPHTEFEPADGTSRAQGEVGARAIAQVGYRILPTLVVAVRGSYQGRTINHAGPGFGGAVTYQW